MSSKAQRMFYAVVVSLSLLIGVFGAAPSSVAACGAGSCGGTGGILSAKTLK